MSDNAFQVITQKHSEKFEVKPEYLFEVLVT